MLGKRRYADICRIFRPLYFFLCSTSRRGDFFCLHFYFVSSDKRLDEGQHSAVKWFSYFFMRLVHVHLPMKLEGGLC